VPVKVKKQIKRVERRVKRKPCGFCLDKAQAVSYRDVNRLRKYVSERGKIVPRRISGTCSKHQRMLTTAIKRARQIAFLPYVAE
jgi:small subunit ribosomal protein S18